jgi:hypothetical protein
MYWLDAYFISLLNQQLNTTRNKNVFLTGKIPLLLITPHFYACGIFQGSQQNWGHKPDLGCEAEGAPMSIPHLWFPPWYLDMCYTTAGSPSFAFVVQTCCKNFSLFMNIITLNMLGIPLMAGCKRARVSPWTSSYPFDIAYLCHPMKVILLSPCQ